MLGCLVIDLVDQEQCFKYILSIMLSEQPLLVLPDKHVLFMFFIWDIPHYFSILTSLIIRVLYPCYLHAIAYLLYSLIFDSIVPMR